MKLLHVALLIGASSGGALAATPTPTPTPTPPDTVAGFWEQTDSDGNVGAWFYFSRVKGLWQGRLVKLFKPPNVQEKDLITTCVKCDGDQKDAPMLGLTIIKGMKRDGRKYQDGSILDPRDGNVYHAQMELSQDGQTLAVRGYLGIPLLGQTQTWNRLPDDSIPADKIPKDSLGPSAQAQQATPSPTSTKAPDAN
jgi:uncharacterized protein (DUF2147 family)